MTVTMTTTVSLPLTSEPHNHSAREKFTKKMTDEALSYLNEVALLSPSFITFT